MEHVITRGTKWRSQYSDYATVWIIEGCVFESFHLQDTLFSLRRRDHLRGPPSVLFSACSRRSERDADQLQSSVKVKNAWSSASTTTDVFMPCTAGQPLPITTLQVYMFSRTDAPRTLHTPSLFILFFFSAM